MKQKDAKPFVYTVTGFFAGWYLQNAMKEFLHIPLLKEAPFTTWTSVSNFWSGYRFILRHFTIHSCILVLHLGFLGSGFFMILFTGAKRKIVWWCMWLSALGSFLIPVLTGFMNSVDTFRYLMHSYVIALLLIPVFTGWWVPRRIFTYGSGVLTLLYIVFVSVWAVVKMDAGGLHRFFTFQPSYTKWVHTSPIPLKNGISDYWTTKSFYLLSPHPKRVVSVDAYLDAYIWEANETWFIKDGEEDIPVFNFTYNLRADTYLGAPLDSLGGGSSVIYIYPDFTFVKEPTGRIHIHKFP